MKLSTRVLSSRVVRGTFGSFVCFFRLRKIDRHARAIFDVPDSEWAPWAPEWYIEKSNRIMRGEDRVVLRHPPETPVTLTDGSEVRLGDLRGAREDDDEGRD